jgi:hypothetical protein
MLGETVPDEVALTVLSHLDDPLDLLQVAETCRPALRLARGSPPPKHSFLIPPTTLTGGGGWVSTDRQLWEVVLRRLSHERAVRWCSLVLDGIPPHLARGASGGTEEEVGIVEWARFFARHKRALVACLRPHYPSDRMATALAEVLTCATTSLPALISCARRCVCVCDS